MSLSIYPIHLPGGDILRLHLAPFVWATFDPVCFSTAGIVCPESVARSVRKRQAEFFHGRLAARAALRNFGASTLDVPVGGSREPVWPAEVVGSISHLDDLAGAVVGPRRRHVGLGIDLERTALGSAQSALRQIAVDGDELTCLQAGTRALTLDERVTLAFSAKESLYKAIYSIVGRFFGFEAARVEAVDEARGVVILAIAEDLHPLFARGRHCELAYACLDARTFVTAFEAAPR